MRSLKITLHSFGTEHSAVERKLLPRLEPDDLVIFDLELNAALLAAETAVRLDEAIGLDTGRPTSAGHHGPVWPEAFDDFQVVYGNGSHIASAVVTPERALRETEQRAAAPRANLLIVVDAVHAGNFVREAKLAFDDREVAHHERRGERLSASSTTRLFAAGAGILVETDAELCRP